MRRAIMLKIPWPVKFSWTTQLRRCSNENSLRLFSSFKTINYWHTIVCSTKLSSDRRSFSLLPPWKSHVTHCELINRNSTLVGRFSYRVTIFHNYAQQISNFKLNNFLCRRELNYFWQFTYFHNFGFIVFMSDGDESLELGSKPKPQLKLYGLKVNLVWNGK